MVNDHLLKSRVNIFSFHALITCTNIRTRVIARDENENKTNKMLTRTQQPENKRDDHQYMSILQNG
jgi:hypothetical protein